MPEPTVLRKLSTSDPRPPVSRCRCRHTAARHAVNTKGMRARCTAGSCPCRLFVKAVAGDR